MYNLKFSFFLILKHILVENNQKILKHITPMCYMFKECLYEEANKLENRKNIKNI